MAKPANWKLRAAIAIAVLFLGGIGFVFSSTGFEVMRDKLRQAYQEAPESERSTHWAADYWLDLAWFEGFICGRREIANELYFEFIGIKPTDGMTFVERYRKTGMAKWNGLMDPDTKNRNGWGIWHDRAPEAFFNYLELNQSFHSAQSLSAEAEIYHLVFHDLYMRVTRSQRPHPKFYVWWNKVDTRFYKAWRGAPALRVVPMPAGYEGPPVE